MIKDKFYDTLAMITDNGFDCNLSFEIFGVFKNDAIKEIYVPNIKFYKGSHNDILKKLIKKGDIKLPEYWKKIKKSYLFKYECLGLVADIPHEYHESDNIYDKYLLSFIDWSSKYCRMDVLDKLYDKYREVKLYESE